MLQRRKFLFAAAGLSACIAGCTSGTSGDTTVQGVIDWLKTNCAFTTNANSVIAVITSLIGSFNAAAGAAAVVVAGIATQVENAVCNAVKQQVAQMKAEGSLKATASNEITVTVNGVPVPGTYTGS